MPLSIRRLRGSQSHADMRAPSGRKEISAPMGLISTTNMLSYEAPDLPVARQMMAAKMASDYPATVPDSPTHDVPALTPDGSSAASSPSVEYNHLSAYFQGPTTKRSLSARKTQAADLDAPAIPKRVPSHSKREHERLARKRSLQSSGQSSPSSSSPPSPTFGASFSGADNGGERTSLELIGVNGPEPIPKVTSNPTRHRSPTANTNPFSPELEQLNEVAEVEGLDEDVIYMREGGLTKCTAAEYRLAIGECYPKNPFNDDAFRDNSGGWI